MVDKINCYRYCSDFSGYDFIVVIEEGTLDNAEQFIDSSIDDLIGTWFEVEGNEDIYYIPLEEYIKNELENKGLVVSIYNFNIGTYESEEN